MSEFTKLPLEVGMERLLQVTQSCAIFGTYEFFSSLMTAISMSVSDEQWDALMQDAKERCTKRRGKT
ncbi:MAG TPA: hypothetical protein VFB79_21445 [Candidatus Angelobacter sp.]|nr:hypothetical protein [Candidatus Angelobacter sp.]